MIFAIGHLANGCRLIQKLKLDRNAFSCASELYTLILIMCLCWQ